MRKKIKITEKNRHMLATAIKAAEGKATARTITPDDIMHSVDVITKKLDICKKSYPGISYHVDIYATSYPSAYHYVPYSTQYDIVWGATGAFVTNIKREPVRSPGQQYVCMTMTDAAKHDILEHRYVFREE